MRIAIIGAGNVGGALGRRWAERGHEVTFGVRDPAGAEVPSGTRAVGVAESVRGADAVVLATPWNAVPDALRAAGSLDGRLVIDATNPLTAGLGLDVGPNGESAAERVQALVPGARVVKAFNTTGANNMADPVYGGEPVTMLYAGDDATAKTTARGLIADIGFEPVDAGPLVRARALEQMALLWIALAMGVGVKAMGRDIAFTLVHRGS